MKKQIILIITLSSFLYVNAQEFDARKPQSVEISTTEISVEDLYSYAKYWLLVQARMVDGELMDKFRNQNANQRVAVVSRPYYHIQTSYVTEDFNSQKVYGLLEFRFQRPRSSSLYFASFRLILSCEENKVTLTMCCGLLETVSFIQETRKDRIFSRPAELQPTDGKMEWEALKKNFTDFFTRIIYEREIERYLRLHN